MFSVSQQKNETYFTVVEDLPNEVVCPQCTNRDFSDKDAILGISSKTLNEISEISGSRNTVCWCICGAVFIIKDGKTIDKGLTF